jgi:hypothetical protein
MTRVITRGSSIAILALFLAFPAFAQPKVQSAAVDAVSPEMFGTDFYLNGNGPHLGPEGSGAYYYPGGSLETDPQTGQKALFLFVQGGQTDSADLWLESGQTYQGCGADEIVLFVIPASDLGTPVDQVGGVLTPNNTRRVTPCLQRNYGNGLVNVAFNDPDYFEDSRNNRSFFSVGGSDYAHFANIWIFESGPEKGADRLRSWTKSAEVIVDSTTDGIVRFVLPPSPSVENFSNIGGVWTRTKAEWHGLTRINKAGSQGALQTGQVNLIYSPYLYGSTDPWRVELLAQDNTWKQVDPVTKVVDFSLKAVFSGEYPQQIFWNDQASRYEAWFIDPISHNGNIPPGCSGSPYYRNGFSGQQLRYRRFWADWTYGSPVALGSTTSPFLPNRPGAVDYSVSREGGMRVNYNGARWLLSAHADPVICDPDFQGVGVYQGVRVSWEALTSY